jgi:hypothetical protein
MRRVVVRRVVSKSAYLLALLDVIWNEYILVESLHGGQAQDLLEGNARRSKHEHAN